MPFSDDAKRKVIEDLDKFDALSAISGLEMSLAEQGYKFHLGAGVAAAQRVLAEQA